MNRVSLFLACLLASASVVLAQGPDDLYLSIYNMIQEADGLAERDQNAEALAKYVEARTTLQRFQKGYPEWSADVVKFRLNYLGSRITALSAKVPPQAPPISGGPAAATTTPGALEVRPQPKGPSEMEVQLTGLRDQVRQLQEERSLLESKLKEALSAQPAAADPRELAKSQDRIKSLQKENELLTAAIEEQKSRPKAATDTNAVANAQRALQEVNQLLAAEKENVARVALERDALQSKLRSVTSDSEASAALRSENQVLKKQLEELKSASGSTSTSTNSARGDLEVARAQLAALQSDKELLSAERDSLRGKLTSLNTQLESAKSAAGASESATRQIQDLQSQITALQKERDSLKADKATLERRLADASVGTTAGAATTAKLSSKEAARLKELERERADLLKKLEAANKQLSERKSAATAKRLRQMTDEIAGLRARLKVAESVPVAFTREELALMEKPPTQLGVSKQPSVAQALPAASAALVAEARRDFASRQFEKAEAKYKQVISDAGKSAPALADLAAIQMEQNKLEEAEKNITAALEAEPENAFALSVLGQLRVRQSRFDDALNALTRAAAQEPDNAEIQNWLGVTYSEKGNRVQAESSLRKALQVRPGFAPAHSNLAVVYATQNPPMLELARWHYQRALASGQPKNPTLEKLLETGRVTK